MKKLYCIVYIDMYGNKKTWNMNAYSAKQARFVFNKLIEYREIVHIGY